MKDEERLLIEQQCARLCIAFHVYVDRYDHEKVVDLFAPDAYWVHRIGTLRGHADFARYLESKSTFPVNRHVVSNILIDVVDENHATGQAYITVYYGEPDGGPPQIEPPILLVQYHDEYVRTPQGWRFAGRRPEIVFTSAAAGKMIRSKEEEAQRKGASQ